MAVVKDARPPAPPAWPGEVRPGSRFGPEGDQHEVGEEIGSGAAARVFACRRLRTGEELAVKVVNLQRLRLLGDLEGHLARLDREVQILRQLHHERIVNLRGFHRTEYCYFLVMERVRGGELFNQIVHRKCLTEPEARHIFRQLLEGVGYMHSKRVIHRDLKPENILIVGSRPAPGGDDGGQALLHDVKIADFGLSKVISEGASLARTCVGTPQYWAPEVLNVQRGGGTYNEAADFWGLGAVLFVMLCGKYPFDGKKMPMDEQIRTAAFSMGGARWRGISEEAKDLIRGLLRVDPAQRLRLADCLQHPWVVGGGLDVGQALAEDGALDEEEEEPRAQEEPEQCAAGGDPAEPASPLRQEASPSGSRGGEARLRPSASGASQGSAASPASASAGGFSRASTSSASCAGDEKAHSVSSRWRPPNRWLLAALCLLAQLYFLRSYRTGEVRNGHEPGGALQAQQGSPLVLTPTKQPGQPGFTGSLHQPPRDPQVTEGAAACHEHLSKDTIFRLSELLKLQISIVGSLEMARLAFRHADGELAVATQETFRQARELFQNAANLVLNYAQVAQQVSQSILPDLRLAVEERQPSLAISLLGVVKAWVTDMKRDGDSMRARYTELQEAVVSLARRAQVTKTDADRRLAEALRAAEDEGRPEGGPAAAGTRHARSVVSARPVATPDLVASAISSGAEAPGGAVAAGPLAAMNSLTRHLFEQLGAHTGPGSEGNMADGKGLVIGVGDSEDDEKWKRNVIDLLFMAPGAVPSLDEDANATARSSLGAIKEASTSSAAAVATSTARADSCEADDAEDTQDSSPVVRFVQAARRQDAQSEAELATNSSAALLRALRELRRVDAILQGCSAFWANMDGTVQKLEQMKDVTERLVGFASSSERLRERFDQRLTEYAAFWASLERLCRQYGLDHQVAAGKMQDFVREVADAADLLDTAESARAGSLAARRARRHSEQSVATSDSLRTRSPVAEPAPHPEEEAADG